MTNIRDFVNDQNASAQKLWEELEHTLTLSSTQAMTNLNAKLKRLSTPLG